MDCPDLLLPEEYIPAGYSRPKCFSGFKIVKDQKNIEVHKPILYSSHQNSRPRSCRTVYSNATTKNDSTFDAQRIFDYTSKFLETFHIDPNNSKLPSVSEIDKNLGRAVNRKSFKISGSDFLDYNNSHKKFMNGVAEIIDPIRIRPLTSHSKASDKLSLNSNETAVLDDKSSKSGKSKTNGLITNGAINSSINSNSKKCVFVKQKLNTRKKRSMTKEETIKVCNFMKTSSLESHPKTLADYKLELKTRDVIWNSEEFSTLQFMSNYIKSRDLMFSQIKPKKVKKEAIKIPIEESKPAATVRRQTKVMNAIDLKKTKNPKYTDNHISGSVLLKPPLERTNADKLLLFKDMRLLKGFKKMSDFTLTDICGSLTLLEFPSNRVIFSQGDYGSAWYIILSGSVSVQISFTGSSSDSKEVIQLHEGDGFGELALLNDEPRAATILTRTNVQVVYIERSDFSRIVKFSYEKDIKEKILFLKKIEILSDLSVHAIKSIAQVMEWKTFEPGSIIRKEGEAVVGVYIIKSGIAVATKAMHEPKSNTIKQVVVGRLKEHDYFGEEGVFALLDGANGMFSSDAALTSVYASRSGPVELVMINCIDARLKMPGIKKNGIHERSDNEVKRIYQELKARQQWEAQKKQFFNKMAIEKTNDPNMTAIKLKNLNTKKKNSWKF